MRDWEADWKYRCRKARQVLHSAFHGVQFAFHRSASTRMKGLISTWKACRSAMVCRRPKSRMNKRWPMETE